MTALPLPLPSIQADADVQSRTALHEATVREYATSMREGAQFPPIIVFHEGETYWLADGFHRVAAARLAGRSEILAELRDGDKRAARIYAAAANAAHGLRRSNADKRRAVGLLLADPEWSKKSDREIARHCGVTHPFVAAVRRDASGNGYRLHPIGDLPCPQDTVPVFPTEGEIAHLVRHRYNFMPHFESVVELIAATLPKIGLRCPIVLFEGAILDGALRLEACRRAGVAPIFCEFIGEDPLAFCMSMNMRRGHLDESQRAMVGARVKILFEAEA